MKNYPSLSAMKVLIQRLDDGLPLPAYAKPGDAGADLYSRIDFTLEPGERKLIPTGISIALPPGYVALVHPRMDKCDISRWQGN